MWILVIISFTVWSGEKHYETGYKTEEQCYKALDAAAKSIPKETIRYIGCLEKNK